MSDITLYDCPACGARGSVVGPANLTDQQVAEACPYRNEIEVDRHLRIASGEGLTEDEMRADLEAQGIDVERMLAKVALTIARAARVKAEAERDVAIARAGRVEAALDGALDRIFEKLGLSRPATSWCDPVEAIVLDIERLLGVQRRWEDACDLAREYCPVEFGESHIRDGIPRLAKKAERAEEQRDRAKQQLRVLRLDAKPNAVSWIDLALADDPPKGEKT